MNYLLFRVSDELSKVGIEVCQSDFGEDFFTL